VSSVSLATATVLVRVIADPIQLPEGSSATTASFAVINNELN